MTFEIIKNSESYTGFDIKDDIFIGYIQGLACGWQFEYVNEQGEYAYGGGSYEECTPEEYAYRFTCDDGSPWIAEVPRRKGYELTGRVVFRGYGRLYYDADEREWFVEDVNIL